MSTTTWIKEKDKKANETKTPKTTENFAPLSNLLKTKPIKSVYIDEPTDARNEIAWAEPLDDVEPLDVDSSTNDSLVETLDTITGSAFDNIKGLEFAKPPKEVKTDDKKDRELDEKRIKGMLTTVVTSLVVLFMSYNLYFNFTNGSEIIQLDDKIDKIPLKEGSSILSTLNTAMSTSIPTVVHALINNNIYLKYRTLFLCLLYICYRLLHSVILVAYNFIMGLQKQKATTIFRYLFSFKGNNVLVTILFFFFLLKNLYTMFTKQGSPVVTFITANPFLSALLLFIYVVLIYPITTALVTFVIYSLVIFYCLFTIIYYYFAHDFDVNSPNYGVESLSQLFAAITAHLTVSDTHVIFKNRDNSVEKFFKMLWTNFHYTYIIILFMTLIPSIMKLRLLRYKIVVGLITLIIILTFSCIKYYGSILETVKKLFKL